MPKDFALCIPADNYPVFPPTQEIRSLLSGSHGQDTSCVLTAFDKGLACGIFQYKVFVFGIGTQGATLLVGEGYMLSID
jgi:hypothetical protein